MASRKSPRSRLLRSPYQRRFKGKSSSFWRPAIGAELRRMGASPKSERLVPKDAKRVSSKTPFLTRSEFVKKRNLELYGEGLGPAQAARRRARGTLGYTSQASAEQARKQTVRRAINAAMRAQVPQEVPYGPEAEAHHTGSSYLQSGEFQGRVGELLRKRLIDRERLDDGDWHAVRDYVHATGRADLYRMLKEAHYHRNELGLIL